MKKFLFPIIIVLTLFTFNAWGADVKIGYVDLSRALIESARGAEARKVLEDMVKTKQGAIDKMKDDIDRLDEELRKQASVLTPEAKSEKEEQRERLFRDYQRLVKDSEDELKKKEARLTQGIIRDLRETIKKIGEEENYAIILGSSEDNILYGSKKSDITEKVIKVFNETVRAKK